MGTVLALIALWQIANWIADLWQWASRRLLDDTK